MGIDFAAKSDPKMVPKASQNQSQNGIGRASDGDAHQKEACRGSRRI